MEPHSTQSYNKSFMKHADCNAMTESMAETAAPGLATRILILSVKITFLKKEV